MDEKYFNPFSRSDDENLFWILDAIDHPEDYTPEQQSKARAYVEKEKEDARLSGTHAINTGAQLDWGGWCGRGVEGFSK